MLRGLGETLPSNTKPSNAATPTYLCACFSSREQSLLSSLIVMRPPHPERYIRDKILEILNGEHTVITWYDSARTRDINYRGARDSGNTFSL